ncbi:MAG: hypothetical protein OEZ68_19435 [Gammaproteobacteria bacterium]|nr:hypothetical protein [Gammaproteobacteria bacterium]MDH5802983.1 hypothetical protein [Gammaproteobacteria bacterium]
MLSKLIVSSYEALIEAALWLFLVICLVGGWYGGSTMDQSFVGAISGLILGFVFAVMFFGAFLVLSDIRKSVRELETLNASKQ